MRILRGPFFIFATAWLFAACASSGSRSGKPAANSNIIDVLTLFVESVQGDRFDQAMKYLSLSERARFEAAGGPHSPYVQRQLKALRLSTLARRPTVKQDSHGLLEGIYDQLPELPYTSESPANPPKTPLPFGNGSDTASTPGNTLPDLP